jgi:hypothetical protein
LQNIVKSNAQGIHCTSAYAAGKFLRPRAFLKSHAVSEIALSEEMRSTWKREAPRNGTIIIRRDPRDVMISYYDFLQTVFAEEIDPTNLFDHDFDWLRSEYRKRLKTNVSERHSERAGQEKDLFNVADALKEWQLCWKQMPQDSECLHLKFEDLISDPQQGFGRVMDYLNLPKPDQYVGLKDMVSQHGESTRTRGQAGGWRNAPAVYEPIIEQTMALLANEVAEMGYPAS